MDKRHPGLTSAIAASNLEAASVCLDRHHVPRSDFELDANDQASTAMVDWSKPSARAKAAWANETDTTEAGACTLVLAAVELTEGLVAVSRAETLTGADYYVAPKETGLQDLEACKRLEVSGVDRGDIAAIGQRLKAKLVQAAKGSSDLPAIAGVAGFKARFIQVADLANQP